MERMADIEVWLLRHMGAELAVPDTGSGQFFLSKGGSVKNA